MRAEDEGRATRWYAGYLGRAIFDAAAGVWHGEVEGIRDVVTFESATREGVDAAFKDSVDDYLAMCAERREAANLPTTVGQRVAHECPRCHMYSSGDEGHSCTAPASPPSPVAAPAIDERPVLHGRNCPATTPSRDEDCSCGLIYRQQLWDANATAGTNWSLYMAWRKRGEEAESQLRTLQEENEAMRGLDAEADALQGEVDALTEWQRNVCELLTCEGDRGPLFAEFAEARIHELLAYERAALSSKTETAE